MIRFANYALHVPSCRQSHVTGYSHITETITIVITRQQYREAVRSFNVSEFDYSFISISGFCLTIKRFRQ